MRSKYTCSDSECHAIQREYLFSINLIEKRVVTVTLLYLLNCINNTTVDNVNVGACVCVSMYASEYSKQWSPQYH